MANIALIGAGKIGALHAANIRSNPRARLAWIADPAPGAAERLAAPGERATTDPAQAIAAADVDAVWVAAPTSTHVELILAAVAAGRPVFCEKPVDLDLDRARRCRQQVEAAGGRVMIGFNRRFDPTYAGLRARVAGGEVGQIQQVAIYARDPEPPPLAYVPTSGGIFRDMSIHDFDMARWLVGDIETVYAVAQDTDPDLRQAGDFGAAVILLQARCGAAVTVASSRWCAYGYDQRVEVFGSQGMLQALNQHPTQIAAFTSGATSALGRLKDHYMQRFAEAYRRELDAFLDAAAAGGPLQPGLEEGVAALEVSDAAARSAASGAPVRLAPPPPPR
ncbi:MAG: Gfo/Idh/MocA family oxidoreductase [Bifidobacteriaceae bacterium]|jgi:myo-inositol 2-dehydrogenase/D-chiro-inositol 1-dehydrogenase|nr:Gfo/Idh/MocA family oxidoreductase [Bifidobacteriaceae bacterium]